MPISYASLCSEVELGSATSEDEAFGGSASAIEAVVVSIAYELCALCN